MKILITGNMGYVGPGVVRQLRNTYPNATIIGYDLGFFAHCVTGVRVFPETLLDSQVFGDVRTIHSSFLVGFDVVVHMQQSRTTLWVKRLKQLLTRLIAIPVSGLLRWRRWPA